MDDIERRSIDVSTTNAKQLLSDDNISLGNVSTASSETNYVRRMAKHFEQITDTSWTENVSQENYKRCNWWLRTPSIDEFDGLTDGKTFDDNDESFDNFITNER